MRQRTWKLVPLATVASSLLALALPVQAATWDVSLGSAVAPNTTCDTVSNSGWQNNCKTQGDNGTVVDVYGYASTGADGAVSGTKRWAAANLTDQGSSGLGIDHRRRRSDGTIASTNGDADEGSSSTSEHGIDGNGRTDAVLFKFSSSTILSALRLGWVGSDADISVLYWAGPLTGPTMSDYYVRTDGTYGTASNNASKQNMIGNGWQLLGNFADNAAGTVNLGNTTATSGWWLITAYNNAFGTTSSNGGSLQRNNDYFKLLSVSNYVAPPPPGGSVPAPGVLALALVALAGMGLRKRRA